MHCAIIKTVYYQMMDKTTALKTALKFTLLFDVPHRYPLNVAFYIFIQQIYVPNILNMVYTLRFFYSLLKMQFVS